MDLRPLPRFRAYLGATSARRLLLLHLPRFDETPARFTAVGDASGVREPHLVKIVPLRVCGLNTCWTIAPRQVLRGERQMAVSTSEPRVRLPHEHQLAMRAGVHGI